LPCIVNLGFRLRRSFGKILEYSIIEKNECLLFLIFLSLFCFSDNGLNSNLVSGDLG
jgi:hypothetical protein